MNTSSGCKNLGHAYISKPEPNKNFALWVVYRERKNLTPKVYRFLLPANRKNLGIYVKRVNTAQKGKYPGIYLGIYLQK